jgi:putative membrane protein
MKTIGLMALATTALALGGCGRAPETTVQNTTEPSVANYAPAAPALAPGQAFANEAAASDAFEIATSRLALEKSQSASVKRFANHMITAHTESTAKLQTAAGSASPAIVPDPALTAEQTAKLQELEGLSGAEFDRAYIAAQVDGHQKTLDGLKAYSANGDVPQLKAFATGLVPTVTAHLNMAKGLKL